MSGLTDTLPNAFDSQPTALAGTKSYQPEDVGGSVPLWSASHHRSTSVEYFSRQYSSPEKHGSNSGVFSSRRQSVAVQDHGNPNPLTTTLLQSNYRAGNLNSTHIQIGGDLQYLPAYQELSSTALPPLPQLRIDDHLPLVDASMLASARNIVDPPELKSATPSEHSLAGDAETWSPSSREPPMEATRRRPRREKPHIDLAPGQPPTTQGKARARVYVACMQWSVPSAIFEKRLGARRLTSFYLVEIERFDAMVPSLRAIIVVFGPTKTRNARMMLFPNVVGRIKPQEHANAWQET